MKLQAPPRRSLPRLPGTHAVFTAQEVRKASKLLPRVLHQANDPIASTAAYLLLSKILEAQMQNVAVPRIESSIARTVRALTRTLH
jgi:hypothetical protein